MNGILERIREGREYTGLRDGLFEGIRYRKNLPHGTVGLCEGALCAVLALLCMDYKERFGHPALIFAPEKQQSRLCASLRACGLWAEIYPERDFSFYNITASHEFEQTRIGIMSAVLGGQIDAVITTPHAVLQRTLPPGLLSERSVCLRPGDQIELDRLCEIALAAGYVRTECADAPGLFSVRGGIFDLYGAGMTAPVRIEFFGDEIDTVTAYDPVTQRRTDPVDEVQLLPAREAVADDAARERIAAALEKLCDQAQSGARVSLEKELHDARQQQELRFADRFIDYIYDEISCLIDYFPQQALFVCTDKNALDEQLRSFEWQSGHLVEDLLSQGLIDPKRAIYNASSDTLIRRLYHGNAVLMSTFGGAFSGLELGGLYEFRSKQTVSYAEKPDLLIEDLQGYLALGYAVDLMCESESALGRISDFLEERRIPHLRGGEDAAGVVRLLGEQLFSGFELSALKYACLSLARTEEVRALRRKRAKYAAKKSKGERILSYADLSVGDYVVHQNYGIGIYTGLQTLTVDGKIRDFVKIKYAGKDVLYLPCDQLDLLSKYIGAHSEDGTLRLNRIGGTEWAKSKSRVKAAAKEMARELIALYAARTRLPGFAFARDDEYQKEFEAEFPYEETEGQAVAAREIKADMEKPYPMDRLLCGDVGFGKTEVAMRAAFKAAMNNKQVAILVPTTILAMQHYQTLSARMRTFPVSIDLLCRFRTPAQQRATLARLAQGKVDILVGTHRILSSDLRFRDLGLLIVDEEQRFGVAHKEKLKQLSHNVDVLTLSATPIPRTLNMAMSGIRDMSILEEAPGDRLPVQSYVLEYDDVIIADALRRELRRGGQVFYLCSTIEALDRAVIRLSDMIPGARIAAAHGQMERDELSGIWQSLLDGQIDILVSTTIIESGVDVPSANTLIVENADRFGLSQLHQLRGRVGRSSRRAYAYFTFPKGKALTEIAAKRLGAIREYTEFGSGFRIALRDLEIRGAGNVLGAEQHGHMDTVGYDLYMKLLNQAVLEEKGERTMSGVECTVSCGKSAYIPESYIRSAAQRIAAYRRISEISDQEEMRDVMDELIDRYGDPPATVAVLLQISLLRALGSRAEIEKIEYDKGIFRLTPAHFDRERWSQIASEKADRMTLIVNAARPAVLYRPERESGAFGEMSALLTEYQKRKETQA